MRAEITVAVKKLCCSGCKENHFYSLPLEQAEASIFTSPDDISTSPQKLFDEQNRFHSFSVIRIPQKTSLALRAS